MSELRSQLLLHPKGWSPKMMRLVALLLGALLFSSPAFALLPFPLTGGQRGTVTCLESPSVTYDVYLPPAYTTNGTALPILYTFNPGGGGMVSDFQSVCASLNIIAIGVIGSANSNTWNSEFRQYYAVSRDVRQRVLFDPPAEFASGFSGGGECSYMFSRLRAQHVAGVLAMGGWLGRINGGPHVNYYSIDRVQTNLLVARTTGTTDTNTIFYNPFDSNYVATCGAVVKDWSCSGGHSSAPDSVKTDCLSWLLSQRSPAGVSDRSNSVVQAADWRSRTTAGQPESVLRECVATLMSQPRTWNSYQAQLVVDDLMTNYNSFRALAVDQLAQGDFASDLFFYLAYGAAYASDSPRYLASLKALTGITITNGFTGTLAITGITVTVVFPTTNGSISITGTNGDRSGDISSLLVQFGYPAPILQSSFVPIPGTPGQMSVWLREDTPGLGYSLQYRSSAVNGNWWPVYTPPLETNTLWSVGINLPPYSSWRFYRVSTAPAPATSAPWPAQ